MAIEHDDTVAAPSEATTDSARPSALAATAPAAMGDGTATDPRRRPPAPPSDDLPAGMRLGHFQLVRKLGAGGMGEVYLATDLALDRNVALKVLPPGTSSGAARERLIREARAQARVQHSNVGHLYFIGEDAGRLYFAMEYVTGKTLGEMLATGPMTAEDALAIVHDTVLGLREAQRSGFTHRDVKPSNLMVDNHGVVKILDFGIAASSASPGEEGVGGPVAQTTLAGTPLYMAPEQARGEPIDFRADIYALGATLYQLVSGQPPFSADSVEKLMTLHASAERPAIPKGRVPRTQQSALDVLIARMMAAKPDDRFASYDDLLRAIENASTQYTRPAGFWVRSIAWLIDMIAIAIVLTVPYAALVGDGNVQMGAIGMPLLALIQAVLIVRFGTTPGGALFELEVIDARTGMRPSWSAAFKRIMWSYGPLVVLAWIQSAFEYAGVSFAVSILKVLYVAWLALVAIRLIHASWRVPGKRTPWDLRSGTMVAYRSGKRR